MNYMQKISLLLAIVATVNAKGQLWKEYADSAMIFQENGNKEKAVNFYMQALDILATNPEDKVALAVISDSLGSLYITLNNYKEAEKNFKRAEEIRRNNFGIKSPEYAISCYFLGFLYSEYLGKHTEAEFFLKSAIESITKVTGKRNLKYVSSCNFLAYTYLNTGRLDDALQLCKEAKEIADMLLGSPNSVSISISINIGSVYYSKTYYDTALFYYGMAKDAAKKELGEEHEYFLNAYQKMACVYATGRSEYSKALSVLLSIRDKIISVTGKKSHLYRQNCTWLGEVYRETGEYELAEEYFMEALILDEESRGKTSNWYASSCWSLGVLYFKMGYFKKAEEYYTKSKNIRENVIRKKNMQYAATCEGLAEVYLSTGQLEMVEPLLLECKAIRESIGGNTFSNYQLGYYYLLTGQMYKAEHILLEGKAILERTKETETSWYFKTLINLANTYFFTGKFNEAKQLFLSSQNLISEIYGIEHIEYANIQKCLAELHWKLNDKKEAYISYIKAVELQEKMLKKIFRFTNEVEKKAYLQMVSNFKSSFFSFCTGFPSLLDHNLLYDLIFSARNLTLLSNLKTRQDAFISDDPARRLKYDTWIEMKRELSVWYSIPRSKRPDNMTDLENRTEKLEKEISKDVLSARDSEISKSTNSKAIQNSLSRGEAAIEFAEFRYYDIKRPTDSVYYMASVLRNDRPDPELVSLFEMKQLDSILSYHGTSPGLIQLNRLYTNQQANISTKEKSLYDLVWKPLESKLEGIKTVYFAPAGSLYKIAFAALPVNDREVLSDRYKLVQLNTTASVADQFSTRLTTTDRVNLYGGVQYNADSVNIKQAAAYSGKNDIASRSIPEDLDRNAVREFDYLPGTQKEITNITRLAKENRYTVTSSSGVLATEESFKSLNGKNSPTILHIATHGFFFPDPKNQVKDERMGGAMVFKQSDNPLLRSGLALAGANNFWKGKPVSGVEDGILTAYEVSNMYLPNTKLAVLSACETGLGDIQGSEGVYGLQRAFKIAGVQNLVMSLWEVPDQATAEFMTFFYRKMFTGQTIEDAFYSAQERMKNKYRNDPHKWAAWVLIR